MDTFQTFQNKFKFDPNLELYVGVERECFIIDTSGNIVPKALEVLTALRGQDSLIGGIDYQKQYGFELSACQVEMKTKPCLLESLNSELVLLETKLEETLKSMGLSLLHTEVAPDDMPLDVFPDPKGRYQEISSHMTKDVLLGACQVIGTHVHVGMPDHETALRVYNHVIQSSDLLCKLGDGSSGKRLEIYKKVAKNSQSPAYATWKEFYESAIVNGFVEDLRSCWTLIRITGYGTIEFRMFGANASIDTVAGWAKRCRTLCEEVM